MCAELRGGRGAYRVRSARSPTASDLISSPDLPAGAALDLATFIPMPGGHPQTSLSKQQHPPNRWGLARKSPRAISPRGV